MDENVRGAEREPFLPKEDASGRGEEEGFVDGMVGEGIGKGVAFFALNEGGEKVDVPFKDEQGGFELIEGEGALVGFEGELVGLLDGDVIGEVDFSFFFIPDESFGGEVDGGEVAVGIVIGDDFLGEVELELGAVDVVVFFEEATIFLGDELV